MKIAIAINDKEESAFLELLLSSQDLELVFLDCNKAQTIEFWLQCDAMIMDTKRLSFQLLQSYRMFCAQQGPLPIFIIGPWSSREQEWVPHDNSWLEIALESYSDQVVQVFNKWSEKLKQKPEQTALTQLDLKNVRVTDLLQMLHQSKWTGVLRCIHSNNTKGEIYLKTGEIYHSHYGPYKGRMGLNQIFQWKSCRFYFLEGHKCFEETIQLPFTHLLLEVMRELDEANL